MIISRIQFKQREKTLLRPHNAAFCGVLRRMSASTTHVFDFILESGFSEQKTPDWATMS